MKTLKRLFIALVIGGILFGATSFLGLFSDGEPKGIPYRTDIVTKGSIAEVITATGTISPEEEVTIGTQVSGKIIGLYAERNDEVKSGQLLAEIDPSIPETQLKQSKAALETAQLAYTLAQRDHERTKSLVAKDYVAKVELERAWQNVVSTKNSLESAKIAVERDQVNLSYTKVTAPIDGIIISQEVTSGQTLASNFQTPNLFRIAKDLTVMKISMNVPESDISKIKEKMSVTFTVDAFPDRTFTGIINTVNLNPTNQAGVVTYEVGVKVENKDRALFPGMTANITITLSEVKDVLRVPAATLRFTPPRQSASGFASFLGGRRMFGGGGGGRRGGGGNTPPDDIGQAIYLWKNNELVRTPVTTGATDDLYIEIRGEEVKEGDIVVTGLKVQEE